MNLPIVVDVAIGLSFVYLSASLFVTIVNEYIAQILTLRGKQLAANLRRLIDDPAIAETLGKLPALAPFFGNGVGLRPSSYVAPQVLAQALVGCIRASANEPATMKQVVASIDGLVLDSTLKVQLKGIAQTVQDDVKSFTAAVEAWVDQSLTMLGEAYKQRQQWISFAVGLVIAVVFNLDTIVLVDRLYKDEGAREAVSGAAAALVEKTDKATFDKCVKEASITTTPTTECATLAGLVEGIKHQGDSFAKLPIGRKCDSIASCLQPPTSAVTYLGWVLTALATALGASFWFDLLGKLVSIRHGMRKPEAKQDAGK